MTSVVDDAQALIRSAPLTPPEHKILCDLVDQSYFDFAAQEILARVKAHPTDAIENVLRSIKADWHSIISQCLAPHAVESRLAALVRERDNGRCLITPQNTDQICDPVATYIIPPKIFTVLNRPSDDTEKSLLTAFLCPENADALRVTLGRDQTTENALLLSPSLSEAFSSGKLTVKKYSKDPTPLRYTELGLGTASKLPYGFRTPSQTPVEGCDGKAVQPAFHLRNLETPSPDRLPLPSLFLLGLHKKLSFASFLFSREQETLRPWPAAVAPKFWSRPWLLFFRRIWHCVPKPIRVWAYRRLVPVKPYNKVVGLISWSSFGLVRKHDNASESAALELLEAEAPDVPAPLVFDTFTDNVDGRRYVVLTQVPGVEVQNVYYRMSYAERHQLADDLAAVLTRVRNIPNKTGHLFCGPKGGKLYDIQAGYDPCGPFETEQEMHTSMSGGHVQYLKNTWPKAFVRQHTSVFTHSDLYLGNVMVDAGRLTGIIDWERAGFYPAWWENCQSVRGAFSVPDAVPMWERIWKDAYKDEIEMAMAMMNQNVWGPPEIKEKAEPSHPQEDET